ncbi:MAG: hypothetical protein JSW48_05260 [Betaproteobacteria bacterium]|nr:MAG: hypothetical protein JSW48_05260 [Betaproteobacteria bacterium]
MAHLVLHAGDKSSDPEQTLVHFKLCGKCASAANLVHVPASPDIRFELHCAHFCFGAAVPAVLASAESTPYTCRDPPQTL